MKIGQIAEIVTMMFLGYVLKSLGWRKTMIIGVLGMPRDSLSWLFLQVRQ